VEHVFADPVRILLRVPDRVVRETLSSTSFSTITW
jgi:hypothetical protein